VKKQRKQGLCKAQAETAEEHHIESSFVLRRASLVGSEQAGQRIPVQWVARSLAGEVHEVISFRRQNGGLHAYVPFIQILFLFPQLQILQ
jgi:hypothetical protein